MSAARRSARPRLSVVDRYRPRTSRAFLESVVAAALHDVGRRRFEVSLLLTDDAEIAELHGRFLGDPTPTDVMSFARDDDDGVDVVVNVECARRVARARGHTIRAETALYVVHGILHACGHDDATPSERARMRAAEARILGALRLRYAVVDGDD